MSSWSDVLIAAPDLARKVQARFDAYGLAMLATLRSDGSPRLSPIEALFTDETIWLGMMHGSTKARDLLRDPRLAMHNATVDKNVADGDAKLVGRAVHVSDDAEIDRARAIFATHTGHPPPEGPMHLFTVDVREISFLMPAGDHLDIESWKQGGKPVLVERR
jgi:hypothetical protein